MPKSNLKPNRERRARYWRGRRGELLAGLWLRIKGYSIIATRHRTPVGEIDIIARRHGHIAFIEVKRRKTIEEAQASVTPRQQQRIARSALSWLSRNPHYRDHQLSLDVIFLAPFKMPLHIRGAFEPDG